MKPRRRTGRSLPQIASTVAISFGTPSATWNSVGQSQGVPMRDLLMIVFTTTFFVVALAYIKGCENLR